MSLLKGIKVLDLSRLLPGPFCTLMLADLGAEVVKVEDLVGGDWTRYMPPLVGPTEAFGAAFATLNRGKKSIALNLKHPEGAEALRRLVATADVLVESFRPGVLDRLGVGYEALKAINPRLVYCAITGYGQSGPYRDRAGHDINYASIAGVNAINGQDVDVGPQLAGVQIADVPGGALYGALGIVSALFAREKSGVGVLVDTSMTDGAFSLLAMHLAGHLAAPEPAGPGQMKLNGQYVCYKIYRCADGYVSLGALETKFWQSFCTAMNKPDWAGRQFDRAVAGEQTFEEIKVEVARLSREQWRLLNERYDFCGEPLNGFDELAGHPLVQARDMIGTVGGVRHVMTPFWIDGAHLRADRMAPVLGADTRAELEAAGYTASEIETLISGGAAAAA